MALNIPVGFSVRNQDPIDDRFVVDSITARNGLDPYSVYEGLLVYVKDSDGSGNPAQYVFIGDETVRTTAEISDANNWEVVGSGGGGITPVTDPAIPHTIINDTSGYEVIDPALTIRNQNSFNGGDFEYDPINGGRFSFRVTESVAINRIVRFTGVDSGGDDVFYFARVISQALHPLGTITVCRGFGGPADFLATSSITSGGIHAWQSTEVTVNLVTPEEYDYEIQDGLLTYPPEQGAITNENAMLPRDQIVDLIEEASPTALSTVTVGTWLTAGNATTISFNTAVDLTLVTTALGIPSSTLTDDTIENDVQFIFGSRTVFIPAGTTGVAVNNIDAVGPDPAAYNIIIPGEFDFGADASDNPTNEDVTVIDTGFVINNPIMVHTNLSMSTNPELTPWLVGGTITAISFDEPNEGDIATGLQSDLEKFVTALGTPSVEQAFVDVENEVTINFGDNEITIDTNDQVRAIRDSLTVIIDRPLNFGAGGTENPQNGEDIQLETLVPTPILEAGSNIQLTVDGDIIRIASSEADIETGQTLPVSASHLDLFVLNNGDTRGVYTWIVEREDADTIVEDSEYIITRITNVDWTSVGGFNPASVGNRFTATNTVVVNTSTLGTADLVVSEGWIQQASLIAPSVDDTQNDEPLYFATVTAEEYDNITAVNNVASPDTGNALYDANYDRTQYNITDDSSSGVGSGLVTQAGAQDISGVKTFTNGANFSGGTTDFTGTTIVGIETAHLPTDLATTDTEQDITATKTFTVNQVFNDDITLGPDSNIILDASSEVFVGGVEVNLLPRRGTWTPVFMNAGAAIISTSQTIWWRQGDLVTVHGTIGFGTHTSTAIVQLDTASFPFNHTAGFNGNFFVDFTSDQWGGTVGGGANNLSEAQFFGTVDNNRRLTYNLLQTDELHFQIIYETNTNTLNTGAREDNT